MALVLDRPWSHLLLISCQQGLIYMYVMYTVQRYDLLITSFALYVTSNVFWVHPIYGFRRNLDRFVVKAHLMYLHYCAYTEYQTYTNYACFILLHIHAYAIYFAGCHFYKHRLYTLYTLTHILLHSLGSLSTLLLINDIDRV